MILPTYMKHQPLTKPITGKLQHYQNYQKKRKLTKEHKKRSSAELQPLLTLNLIL